MGTESNLKKCGLFFNFMKKSFLCLLTSLLIKKEHFCFCLWPQFISVCKLKQFCSLEHKHTVNKKPPGS